MPPARRTSRMSEVLARGFFRILLRPGLGFSLRVQGLGFRGDWSAFGSWNYGLFGLVFIGVRVEDLVFEGLFFYEEIFAFRCWM